MVSGLTCGRRRRLRSPPRDSDPLCSRAGEAEERSWRLRGQAFFEQCDAAQLSLPCASEPREGCDFVGAHILHLIVDEIDVAGEAGEPLAKLGLEHFLTFSLLTPLFRSCATDPSVAARISQISGSVAEDAGSEKKILQAARVKIDAIDCFIFGTRYGNYKIIFLHLPAALFLISARQSSFVFAMLTKCLRRRARHLRVGECQA